MAAEEDNFDIDIYGEENEDAPNDQNGEYRQDDDEVDLTTENTTEPQTADEQHENAQAKSEDVAMKSEGTTNLPPSEPLPSTQTTSESQTPLPQGVKRKESFSSISLDPGATSALVVSDLHWWTTEDDIRGWANTAGYEAELKEITFSEYKVNGKSKGGVFIAFASPQAATATKHTIDALPASSSDGPAARKHTLHYTNPMHNLFKTLPKDAPARGGRNDNQMQRNGSQGGYSDRSGGGQQNSAYGMAQSGGYRGGRGGGYNRGGIGNYNNNRNFSNSMSPAYQNANMNGAFPNNTMGAMNSGFAGTNRGAMMANGMGGGMSNNMRGGRGGAGGMVPMPNMMPNLGFGMNGMNPMNMNMMAGMGMQGGFGGSAHFNPAFFHNAAGPGMAAGGGGDGSWNPHGAKRTRQE